MGNAEQLIIRQVVITAAFDRCMRKATPQMRKRVQDAIAKLLADPRPPGLNIEKILRHPGFYSLRVDRGYRLSFTISGEVAELRRFDAHDDLYNRPG